MNPLCKIRDLQRAIHQFETCLQQQYGIGLNEAMALCCLAQKECLASGQTGQLLGLTPSNTSKVIASIERKGYVSRGVGNQDKRQMYFTLTDKGQELLAAIEKCPPCIPEILRRYICEENNE